jgi:hypothetical protein
MAVFTSVVGGIVGTGWYYFRKWYLEEEKSGRRHIDAHTAEVLREKNRNRL